MNGNSKVQEAKEVDEFSSPDLSEVLFSKNIIEKNLLTKSFKPMANQISIAEGEFEGFNFVDYRIMLTEKTAFSLQTDIPKEEGTYYLRSSPKGDDRLGVIRYTSGQKPVIESLCTKFIDQKNPMNGDECEVQVSKQTGRITKIIPNIIRSSAPAVPEKNEENKPSSFGNDMIYQMCGYLKYFNSPKGDRGVHFYITELNSKTDKISVGQHYMARGEEDVAVVIVKVESNFKVRNDNSPTKNRCIQAKIEQGVDGWVINIIRFEPSK